MAISSYLEFATPMTAADIAGGAFDIARSHDLAFTAEAVLADGATTKLGTWIRLSEAKPRPWNPVITDFGFTPTITVVFRFATGDAMYDQDDDMIRMVSGLLGRFPGDAVLTDYDDIWLLRRGGELSISDREDIWPSHRLAILPEPYRRDSLAFAEE